MKADDERELERQIVARVQSLLPFPVSPDELRTLTNNLVPFVQAERANAALEARLVELDLFEQYLNQHENQAITRGGLYTYKLQRLENLEERLAALHSQKDTL